MLMPVIVDGPSQIMQGHCRRRTPFLILGKRNRPESGTISGVLGLDNSLVGAMYPARMVQSPNFSPSSRSRAYRLIMGFMISMISGSVTLSLKGLFSR